MRPTMNVSGAEANMTGTLSAKRIFFDWTGVVAIVAGAVVWGTTSSLVASNTKEIERLRVANEARAIVDIKNATEMATKADVQRVSDQVLALSIELRNARSAK